MIAAPLLGVWIASSLAAYANARVGWVVASGLLLFPVLPLAWVGLSEWRRRARGVTKPHVLTFGDRIVLRTLVINIAFLVILVAARPKVAFVALAARGDWFLRDHHGKVADAVRRRAFELAGGLEWLYEATHPNPYTQHVPREQKIEPTPPPAEAPTGTPMWPTPHAVHPLVHSIPPDEETSIESVGKYIAAHEKDPVLRIKALHDYVADRIAYDAPAFQADKIPQEDYEASGTFARKIGVCSGYAELLVALGKASGDEIAYVTGSVRTLDSPVDGAPHAWNAAKVNGVWYLLDPTFDAGSVEGSTFHKRYTTDYLFTPPDVFGVSHFPEDPKWQLRDKPISRGDFIRQPMMDPAFYARGMKLEAPDRSQVTVSGRFDVRLTNPSTYLLFNYGLRGSNEHGRQCDVDGFTHASCELPTGRWNVIFFGSNTGEGAFEYLGTFEVNSR
ncbi:MAG TPA: transglutaminase domain-containing protein [Polyangiaceae bacterium]|jgi:transglutaminase-like putative cysteine protease